MSGRDDPCRHVYVLDTGAGYVKVGKARSVKLRLKTLQAGCPFTIKLVHVVETGAHSGTVVEAAAHRLLKLHRVERDWFSCTPQQAIDAVNEAVRHPDPPSLGRRVRRPAARPPGWRAKMPLSEIKPLEWKNGETFDVVLHRIMARLGHTGDEHADLN
jgi:hypothetical protein